MSGSCWRLPCSASGSRPIFRWASTNSVCPVWKSTLAGGRLVPSTFTIRHLPKRYAASPSATTIQEKVSAPHGAAASASDSRNTAISVPAPKKYAVIGGGFAGVAVAWHLLSRASREAPISLDLYDAYGLGAGGSGAAAGLLHPYTNRGKVLWRGLEAFQAAKELVQVAEAAAVAAPAADAPLSSSGRGAGPDGGREPFQHSTASSDQQDAEAGHAQEAGIASGQREKDDSCGGPQPAPCLPGPPQAKEASMHGEVFTWRNGILRPARSLKQAKDLAKFVPQDAATAAATGAKLVGSSSLGELVPGLPAGGLISEEYGPASGLSPNVPSLGQQHDQQQGPHPASLSTLKGPRGLQQRLGAETTAGRGGDGGGIEGGEGGSGEGGRKGRRPKQKVEAATEEGADPSSPAGLLVTEAVVLHPLRYLQAVWSACCQQAQRAGSGSHARLVLRGVHSLEGLEEEGGPYEAVIVAAGAAVGGIQEMQGVLPLQLSQGYTLVMQPGGKPSVVAAAGGGSAAREAGAAGLGAQQEQQAGATWTDLESSPGGSPGAGIRYPSGAPSLLGPTYLSAHGQDSLVVGATKRFGLTPGEALRECARGEVEGEGERRQAVEALLPAAGELWPPVLGWRVGQVKSGVRALPARGNQGAIPFAGRVPPPAVQHADAVAAGGSAGPDPAGAAGTPQGQSPQQEGEGGGQRVPRHNWWFVGGLGARGLVYHAWLGKLLAEAVWRDDENALPAELLRWRDHAS